MAPIELVRAALLPRKGEQLEELQALLGGALPGFRNRDALVSDRVHLTDGTGRVVADHRVLLHLSSLVGGRDSPQGYPGPGILRIPYQGSFLIWSGRTVRTAFPL